MKNNQKGITLVALVITIIVLLILAGVTIAALSGDNGILKRGSEAKVQTNVQNAKDLINLGVQECMTNYYNAKYVTNGTPGDIDDYIINNIMTTQAKSVIASATGTTITTNVKDANGGTMSAEVGTDGSLTWTNDKLTPTTGG